MTVDIRLDELDGNEVLAVSLDGGALQPRGPFDSLDEAEIAMAQIAGTCRALFGGGVHVHHRAERQRAR